MLFDVARLHEFLAAKDRRAAARVVQILTNAPSVLVDNPRLGRQLTEFEPREVRRLIAGRYEIRYEIRDADVYILRLWHTKEDR